MQPSYSSYFFEIRTSNSLALTTLKLPCIPQMYKTKALSLTAEKHFQNTPHPPAP